MEFRRNTDGSLPAIDPNAIGSISPDGSMLTTGHRHQGNNAGSEVRVWDLAAETLLHRMAQHSDEVMSVAFQPTGLALASYSRDGTVKLWDSSTGRVLLTVSDMGPVAFSPDGRLTVTPATVISPSPAASVR